MRGYWLPVLLLFFLGKVLFPGVASGAAEESAFWVWHRKEPLSPHERFLLRDMNAKLYWHIGVLRFFSDLEGAEPEWLYQEGNPEGRATPVVRLDLYGKNPFRGEAGDRLLKALSGVVSEEGRLEIEYDCPEHLRLSYASFLKKLRKNAPLLSITAKAGWVNKEGWKTLQQSVSGIEALFYDLADDPRSFSESNPPQPLLKSDGLYQALWRWRHCGVKWRAGLPNFARLTLYDADGFYKGHIRNWSWDEVIFQTRFKYKGSPAPGTVILKCEEDLIIVNTPITAGSTLVLRWVDRKVLAGALKEVKRSRAKGFIFFRLADGSDTGGWSLPQIQELMAGKVETPRFKLRYEVDRFVLENESKADLPPRIEGDAQEERAYCLEVDAPSRSWKEALPGEFWRLESLSLPPEGPPVPASVTSASRLTFWFSHLPSGEFLKSGLIQFTPGTDLGRVRYRVLPGRKEWTPVEIVLPKVE